MILTTVIGGLAAVGTYINVNKLFRAVGGNSTLLEIFGGAAAATAAGAYVWKTSNKLCEAVASCFNEAKIDVKVTERVVDPVPEKEDHSLEVFINEKGERFYMDFDGKLHRIEPEGTVVE